MNNLVMVNHAVTTVVNQYVASKGYGHSVLFESKMMVSQDSVMFDLIMLDGVFINNTFRVVFPSKFITSCTEDNAVKMVSSIFKSVIDEREKLELSAFENDSFQAEVTKLIKRGQ